MIPRVKIIYQITITLALLTQVQTMFSCSCPEYIDDFCYAVDTSKYIALVELIAFEDESAARFKLIENIHKEIPEIIDILGADGANCNLNLEQFKVGDTLIINTIFYPQGEPSWLNGKYYNWAIDDCSRHYLNFSSNKVIGKIDAFTTLEEMEYEAFRGKLLDCFLINRISNEIKDDQVLVFPNPFYDEISIVTSGRPIIELKIYTLEGRLVSSRHNFSTHSSVKIFLQSLASGIFILEIKTAQGNVRKRIIKI